MFCTLQPQTRPLKLDEQTVIGDGSFSWIAGPCSVESYEQLKTVAHALSSQGVRLLRGGTFKARTSKDSFQGLGTEAIDLLYAVAKEYGMLSVTEVTGEDTLAYAAQYIDILQIGARNAQNYRLLEALGKTGKPIIIKRGFGETLEELIQSTRYIEATGNSSIILCERGIRTFEPAYRFTLDITSVLYLKEHCVYPVFIDPSHASGTARYVAPLTQSAAALGADGVMVEVHPCPNKALSDALQQITPEEFSLIFTTSNTIRNVCECNLKPSSDVL